jgi:Mrp family chromosome partitioning ATPase
VERLLGIPLFLTIPTIGKAGKIRKLTNVSKQLELEQGKTGGPLVPVQPKTGGTGSGFTEENSLVLNTFHETLRDRLISYFESVNLTHKPKLVAVTGLGRNSGVTTTAAGLARSLSETGEGNVLLVDMTAGQGSAHQFYRGKDVVGLEDILSTRDEAQVQDKLYVVAEEPGREKLSRILPQRFTKLVPKLKASNFDYIIFDMPAVSQISITPRLAGFMDMVLMVIESEKTDRELVQRATSLLAQSNAHVGAVLHKAKNYVPAALHQEYLGNS